MDKLNVLVVDDDLMVLRATCRMLRRIVNVAEMNDSKKACDILLSGAHFDAIVTDVVMPDFTGKDLFEQVTAKRPELASKFIFLTGGASSPELQAFINNASNVLHKPASLEEVSTALAKATGRAP